MTGDFAVYDITNIRNGHRYIGVAREAYARWGHHKRSLGKGAHHSPLLQVEWNEYGADAFVFRVIVRDITEKRAKEIEGDMLSGSSWGDTLLNTAVPCDPAAPTSPIDQMDGRRRRVGEATRKLGRDALP